MIVVLCSQGQGSQRKVSSLILPERLTESLANKEKKKLFLNKMALILLLSVVYLTSVALIYYEYEYKDTSGKTELSVPSVLIDKE